MRVFIYWNLHRKVWSIKALEGINKGRVLYHANAWTVSNPVFKVSEAGRQRVLLEKRKNVHAGIVGELKGWLDTDSDEGSISSSFWNDNKERDYSQVTYNPYKGPTFESINDDNTRKVCMSAVLATAHGRTVLAHCPQSILSTPFMPWIRKSKARR